MQSFATTTARTGALAFTAQRMCLLLYFIERLAVKRDCLHQADTLAAKNNEPRKRSEASSRLMKDLKIAGGLLPLADGCHRSFRDGHTFADIGQRILFVFFVFQRERSVGWEAG